ncbi:hypothetical protein [Burkholderia stabilis]|uniref:hypothetical protein n=1 Tax=Burkholderia stabilis TaxID=95485 RepID=UPI001011AF5F|nr:hypothetical protein [Burkholderia stabilis]
MLDHGHRLSAVMIFRRVLRLARVPQKIVTDQLRSCPAANAEMAQLAGVKRLFVKSTARVNNRAHHSRLV